MNVKMEKALREKLPQATAIYDQLCTAAAAVHRGEREQARVAVAAVKEAVAGVSEGLDEISNAIE